MAEKSTPTLGRQPMLPPLMSMRLPSIVYARPGLPQFVWGLRVMPQMLAVTVFSRTAGTSVG